MKPPTRPGNSSSPSTMKGFSIPSDYYNSILPTTTVAQGLQSKFTVCMKTKEKLRHNANISHNYFIFSDVNRKFRYVAILSYKISYSLPMATQKCLVLHEYGKNPSYQDYAKPEPKEGQFLIRVDASTINPSDRMRIAGFYFPVPLPTVVGFEGTGRVVEANGADIQHWVGKRVSFTQVGHGTWAEYSLSNPNQAFIIDEDVPLHSAASGIVNPLTVIGMTEIYQSTQGKKGIIHTAAASALGRMLNKLCQTLGIPLLNIVRKEEQAALLRSEGASHVLVTQGEWQKEYAETIAAHGFNVFFDALGGGSVTQTLILGMNPGSIAYIYGALEAKPLTITVGISLCKGIIITGYLLFVWYGKHSAERKQWIQENYSKWLKTDLATHSLKVLKYSEIAEALELSVSKATEGKITIVPN